MTRSLAGKPALSFREYFVAVRFFLEFALFQSRRERISFGLFGLGNRLDGVVVGEKRFSTHVGAPLTKSSTVSPIPLFIKRFHDISIAILSAYVRFRTLERKVLKEVFLSELQPPGSSIPRPALGAAAPGGFGFKVKANGTANRNGHR